MTESLYLSNCELTQKILEELQAIGVCEYILCPASRNSSLVEAMLTQQSVRTYTWPEERSGAFFALGRARAMKAPVAIVVTSGTAAAELLPACMEAYYTNVPLLLITADRPKRFSGTGAPQSVEQVGLFGCYVHALWDVNGEEAVPSFNWSKQGPAQLNIRYEDPLRGKAPLTTSVQAPASLEQFLKNVSNPFVTVGALPESAREHVCDFLLRLAAPVYLEGQSGLREEESLEQLQIICAEGLWLRAKECGYPIDGVLRIGSVPTVRLWRDLDDDLNTIPVFSVSQHPFTGNPHSSLLCGEIGSILSKMHLPNKTYSFVAWKEKDRLNAFLLHDLLKRLPLSETGMMQAISEKIPAGALVYLGNSLPIREWDLAATRRQRQLSLYANRGVNGIDGQVSTFLGLAHAHRDNWAIIGDLTMLYDLAGLWILDQLQTIKANLIVINNGGGKIFARMYAQKEFQNQHGLSFAPIAAFWGMKYACWHEIPAKLPEGGGWFIEVIPDEKDTQEFWCRYAEICSR